MPRNRQSPQSNRVIAALLLSLTVSLARNVRGDEPIGLRQPATVQLAPAADLTSDELETELVRYVEALQPEPEEDLDAGFLADGLAEDDSDDTPVMRGDILGSGTGCSFTFGVSETGLPEVTTTYGIPLAGGSPRLKIAENNKALPMDRVYVAYNHFHNAFEFAEGITGGSPSLTRNTHVDQYTIGVEKTFFSGRASVELRMPFTDGLTFSESNTYMFDNPSFVLPAAQTSNRISGGEIGNLAVLIKHLAVRRENLAIAVGLGVEAPTGSNAKGTYTYFTDDQFGSTVEYEVRNQAVHLVPFLGLQATRNQIWFFHAFAQLDIPLNQNGLRVNSQSTNGLGQVFDQQTLKGRLEDQTLLYLDASLGCWLWRNRGGTGITGLAALAECHYTGTLQDADIFRADLGVSFIDRSQVEFGNLLNRVDVVNFTFGLNMVINDNLTLAAAAVFPAAGQRFFDSETQVFIQRQY